MSTVSSPALHPLSLPRSALSLAALVAAAVVLDVLGVAGYRYGAPLVSVGLAVGGAGTAWVLTRHRWLAALVAVLALVLGGVLTSRAPWSAGRLEAALGGLEHLDGFDVVETRRDGHSWCRPDCPSVTRTWRAPDTSPSATVVVMALSLSEAGLAPPAAELPPDLLRDRLEIRGSDTDAVVTAERLEPGEMRVTVVLTSHR